MQITKYVPSTIKTGYKQTAKKIIFWQLVSISLLFNLSLAHQVYDVRCLINGEKVGWFIKASTCDDLASAKMDSINLATKNYRKQNEYSTNN